MISVLIAHHLPDCNANSRLMTVRASKKVANIDLLRKNYSPKITQSLVTQSLLVDVNI